MLSRYCTGFRQRLLSFGRELKRVGAAVARIALAHYQAERLHLVYDAHEAAGVHPQPRSQLTLAYSRGMGQPAQNSGLRGCQLQRRQTVRKLLCGMRAYLREQKSRPKSAIWGRRVSSLRKFRFHKNKYCIAVIVNDSNHYIMERFTVSSNPAKRHSGPPLLLPALVYLGLLIAGVSTIKPAFHIPHDSAANAVAYVAQNSLAIRWGSFCELASAMPLGIFVAVTISRLRFLGVRAAGESIAFLGGIIATTMMIFSGLCTWSLTRPGVAEATGAVSTLQALGFDSGGPGFAVSLGLFLAGVSITASLHRFIPRWLMGLGIVVAVACELASLTLLNFTAGYFIPVGRFISIVWMIGISLKLPVSIPGSADRAEANRVM